MWKKGIDNVLCLKESATGLFLHFFIIWISCTPGALCYQNWLPSCKALLNHSTVHSNLCHFMFACFGQVTLCTWSYDRRKKKPPLFHQKKEKKKRKEKNTHGHFSLLLVTSWHIFLSFFREKQKKMQKLASKEDEDKRRIQTETNWQAKTVNQGRERGICFQRSVWVQCVTDKSSHTLFKTKLKRHQIHLHMSSKKKRQFLSTWGHKVYQLFSTPRLCLLLLGL